MGQTRSEWKHNGPEIPCWDHQKCRSMNTAKSQGITKCEAVEAREVTDQPLFTAAKQLHHEIANHWKLQLELPRRSDGPVTDLNPKEVE